MVIDYCGEWRGTIFFENETAAREIAVYGTGDRVLTLHSGNRMFDTSTYITVLIKKTDGGSGTLHLILRSTYGKVLGEDCASGPQVVASTS